MKKVVTMQDISAVGKCSLTVALPIISSMGIETAILPTAILSTHTMFKDFTFHDLTDELVPIMNHWEKENFKFNTLYTAYLGSFKQIDIAKSLFDRFGSKSLKICDPCMADNGKLYPGFSIEYAHKMRELCAKADIICPNLSEAAFLLDIKYEENYDEEYIKDVLKKLCELGSNISIITGVSLEKGKLGAYSYNKKNNTYFYYQNTEEEKHFHGTGDIWASVLCGALTNNKTLEEAITLSCDFVKEAIHITLNEENHNEYGVNFETAIPYLINRL